MKRKTLEISFILILSILFTYKNSEPTAVPNRKVNEASVKNSNYKKIVSNDHANIVKVVASKNSRKTLINDLTELSKIARCLNDKHNYCNKFNKKYRDNNYFLKDQTPIHRQIANKLTQLKAISEQDPEFVGQIPAEILVPFLKLTDNRSPVIALELLFEKILDTNEQNQIITEVINNEGENQWQLYKLLLSMSYLSPAQITTISEGIRIQISKTSLSSKDMNLIGQLDNLMLPTKAKESIANTLCNRAQELELSDEFKRRIYYASNIKCY